MCDIVVMARLVFLVARTMILFVMHVCVIFMCQYCVLKNTLNETKRSRRK
jgi:hypothetical protein